MNQPMPSKEHLDLTDVLRAGKAPAAGGFWRSGLRWSVAFLGGLLLIGFWWFGKGGGTTQYVTEHAARGNLAVFVTATGSVQPTNQVDVSSELSGMVRRVLVDYNTPVTVGQVLAELDTDKLKATADAARAKVAAAKSSVVEAEATVREKDRDYARKQELAGKQVASTFELDAALAARDRAVAGVESAKAAVASAEADLKLAETNLAKTCICSPINGVVLVRNVDPGQTVASSFQAPVLFQIAEDLKQMELQVNVDEADVGLVRKGQSATFTVDTYADRKFPAEVSQVRYASEVVQGVVTYMAVLTIDNAKMLLRPGMTATAEIKTQEVTDALLVPNAALRYTPTETNGGDQRSLLQRLMPGPPRFRAASDQEAKGRQRTMYLLREGAPVAVPVEIGVTDGSKTQIVKADLRPDDQIIIDQRTARN